MPLISHARWRASTAMVLYLGVCAIFVWLRWLALALATSAIQKSSPLAVPPFLKNSQEHDSYYQQYQQSI